MVFSASLVRGVLSNRSLGIFEIANWFTNAAVFCLSGVYCKSGTRAIMAGPARLKVISKTLNNLIMCFSTFRDKEQTLGGSYLLFTIEEAKCMFFTP